MVETMGRGSAGFTLLELMTVLAVIGILVSIAIPSFGYMAANTKVKSASTELYLALIRARSEAVKRNRGVSISAHADGWQAGWRIIADANNDGDYADVATDDDRLLIVQDPLKRVAISEVAAATSVVFRPTGRISGAAPSFEITSEDPDYALQRCISADLTGRAYVKAEACPP